MLNPLISLGAGLVVFALVAVFLQPVAAILPAVIVFGVVFFVLVRRTGKQIEAEMSQVMSLLQARHTDEAIARLEAMKVHFKRWQPLVVGQLDAQHGMIDYLQMKWDDALPRLQNGSWRNWTALLCIGAIHFRKGDKDAAWKSFAKAAKASSKESMVYLVWATLLTRAGKREDALNALNKGLKAMPDSKKLQDLKATIANKKRIDIRAFPQSWYQFFPEDLAKQQGMRGRRGSPMPGAGFRAPRVSRRERRGR